VTTPASTIPAAIDALLEQLRTVAPTDVKVVDGFPRFRLTDTDLIAVGGTAEPTASGDQQPSDVSDGRSETYALRLRATSSRGIGTAQKVVRDRAFAMMDLVDEALALDTSLGGAVHLAEIGGAEDFFQTDAESAGEGTHAEVAFSVLVQAEV
jgi:hypothetical protein